MTFQHCSTLLRLHVLVGLAVASILITLLSVQHYCSTYPFLNHISNVRMNFLTASSIGLQSPERVVFSNLLYHPEKSFQEKMDIVELNGQGIENVALSDQEIDFRDKERANIDAEHADYSQYNSLLDQKSSQVSDKHFTKHNRSSGYNQDNASSTLNKNRYTSLTSTNDIDVTQTTAQDQSDISLKLASYSSIPSQFILEESFQLPWHKSTPVSSIMKQEWYSNLVSFLQRSTPKLPIILVSSDANFKSAIINWLIFSLVLQDNPIKNLLVLTYDRSICSFIEKRQLANCLLVPPENLTSPEVIRHKYGGLYPLLIVRMVIMRILNRLGYNVANFDTDAILLRNPVPVFERYPDSDVIGTFGGGLPGYLLKKWGVVVCMGAIYMKSTNSTESLWESVRRYKSGDDQIKMNNGIDAMDIKWTTKNLNKTNSSDSLSVLWQARGKDNLKITLLPQRIACRMQGCLPEIKGQAYIWHHGKNRHKFKNMSSKAKDDGLWKVRKDWSSADTNTTLVGIPWLREMMLKT